MSARPFHLMTHLTTALALVACTTTASATDPYGDLNGVLAANAPILFVPVGTDDQGCTQYTKKPLREGIMVDTGIWYRTADDHFVMDASECVPDTRTTRPRD